MQVNKPLLDWMCRDGHHSIFPLRRELWTSRAYDIVGSDSTPG